MRIGNETIGNETIHVTEIDWEKRNWIRILTPEEEREIAAKMLRLLTVCLS
jgi:hypothetical protein